MHYVFPWQALLAEWSHACSVQFISVHGGKCVLWKAYVSLPHLPEVFLKVAFETAPGVVWLVKAIFDLLEVDGFECFLFLCLSPLVLCTQVLSQAPQHFRASEIETQAAFKGCFACQPIFSVISLDFSMSMALDPREPQILMLESHAAHK